MVESGINFDIKGSHRQDWESKFAEFNSLLFLLKIAKADFGLSITDTFACGPCHLCPGLHCRKNLPMCHFFVLISITAPGNMESIC